MIPKEKDTLAHTDEKVIRDQIDYILTNCRQKRHPIGK